MQTETEQTQIDQASANDEGCIRHCEACPRVFYSLTPRSLCDRCQKNLLYDEGQEDYVYG